MVAGRFQPPFRISDDTGDAKDGDGTLEGAVPAVGPNGEVYVVWAGPEGSVVRSIRRWRVDVRQGLLIGAADRRLGHPGPWRRASQRHAGDGSRSQHAARIAGTLYVNFIDERNGDTDVFLLASRTAAGRGHAPVRVNDDPKGAAQMFTWMAVDPADGAINMVFHDRRGLTGHHDRR